MYMNLSKFSDCSQRVVLKGGREGRWEGNVWAVNPDCELGPVCDHEWDSRDAAVVCKQLGSNFSIPIMGNQVDQEFVS